MTVSFDFVRIGAFRTRFGDDVFIEVAIDLSKEWPRYSVKDELWLWKEEVQAHVMFRARRLIAIGVRMATIVDLVGAKRLSALIPS
ncbi:hypothetical protein CCGE531_32300 (plasmid) [Rhizobium sp. CCGE531]|nr:hypothetical protein CCGE531_32300 [Rhizobium sp. CCGE531]